MGLAVACLSAANAQSGCDRCATPGLPDWSWGETEPWPLISATVYCASYQSSPGASSSNLVADPDADPMANPDANPVASPFADPNVADPGAANKKEDEPKLLPGFQFRADKTQFRLGGYVKLDAIYDFKDAGNRYYFDPNTFPTTNQRGPQATFHARQSRLNLTTVTSTTLGDLRMYVEGDFFAAANTVRMRHAYGQIGDWLAGQTWTLHNDADAFVETLDFNGPGGNATLRDPQIRWTRELDERWRWAVSLEQPREALLAPADGEFRNRMPNFNTAVRRQLPNGHLYVSAAVGEKRYFATPESESTSPTWIATASWRRECGRHQLIAQYGISKGFTLFVRPLAITGDEELSGTIVIGNRLETLLSQGYIFAYQHVFNSHWRANTSWRAIMSDTTPGQPVDQIRSNDYLSQNILWSPLGNSNLEIGCEYLWGQRTNVDRSKYDAHRIMFSVIYRIP